MGIRPLEPRDGTALAAFLAAFAAAGEEVIPAYFPSPDRPADEVAPLLDGWARGEGLAPGWVPCTTLFLDVDGELVGVVNIRHRLTPGLERFGGHIGYSVRPDRRRRGHAKALLGAALERCHDLGLTEVVLTCAPDNLGSIGAIAAHGGSLVERYHHEGQGRDVLRWTIRSRDAGPAGPRPE